MVGAAAPSAVASEQAAIKAETLSTAEPLSTASPLPPPPPQPHEAKRRRLSATSSLPLWPSSPLGGPASPQLGARRSPLLFPRSPADVDAADWWSLDQLPQVSPGRFALEQLRQYIQDWERAKKDDFWQRKSGKVALSVVVCRGMEDGALVAYRGMNTEVSLPAGSLCSERAAIGRAASSFQRASDILVAATADPQERLNPLWPCEVCQSWLAKLRAQNPDISVLAVESIACDKFVVRVNGETQPPPLPLLPPSVALGRWRSRVVLAEGSQEMPWDSEETVYIDGSWAFMHGAHQHILRVARMRCTHLLVGVHSDEVLAEECGRTTLEDYELRLQRVLHNRYVSSVLKDAPWTLTPDMLSSLGVNRVMIGSVGKLRDCGREDGADPYVAARDLGMLEVVPSLDGTTESSFHESQLARAALAAPSTLCPAA